MLQILPGDCLGGIFGNIGEALSSFLGKGITGHTFEDMLVLGWSGKRETVTDLPVDKAKTMSGGADRLCVVAAFAKPSSNKIEWLNKKYNV